MDGVLPFHLAVKWTLESTSFPLILLMGKLSPRYFFEICIFLQEIGYSSVVIYKGINPGIIGPNFCSLVLGVFCKVELETNFAEIV